jgi:hypothetical protein
MWIVEPKFLVPDWWKGRKFAPLPINNQLIDSDQAQIKGTGRSCFEG